MRTVDARRRRLGTVLGVAAAALSFAIADRHPDARAQGPIAQVPSYTLVDTWRDRPHVLTPGRVAYPVDVTSLADGRTVVLDDRDRLPAALHVLSGDGGQGTVAVLPADVGVRKLDAGPNGELAILSRTLGGGMDVVVAATDGRVGRSIHLPDFTHSAGYSDVAVGADGRFFAAQNDRSNVEDNDASGRIVVLKPSGEVDAVVDLQRWFPVDHRQPGHVHARITALDVGPDGRLFALLYMVPCT